MHVRTNIDQLSVLNSTFFKILAGKSSFKFPKHLNLSVISCQEANIWVSEFCFICFSNIHLYGGAARKSWTSRVCKNICKGLVWSKNSFADQWVLLLKECYSCCLLSLKTKSCMYLCGDWPGKHAQTKRKD